MRKYIIVSLLLLAVMCTAAVAEDDAFFAWMDGYVALPSEGSWSFALTMFYTDKPIKTEDVINVRFAGIDENVRVIDFQVDDIETNARYPYTGRMITLTVLGREKGVYRANSFELTLINGEILRYPIGEWVFDVDAAEPENMPLEFWDSPAVSSNGAEYVYKYTPVDPEAKLTRISMGGSVSLSDEQGLPLVGSVSLAAYEAPIKYIRAKVTARLRESTFTAYDNGCYCGAINAGDDFFDISREHFSGT